MKDETYSYISDVKEKGIVARSSHNRRSHTGKGGRCRLPHENLSKKELQKMSGDCKSYSLNSPMTREQFLEMPDDLKVIYIKAIRNKYGTPDSTLGRSMGFSQQAFSKVIARLGIATGKNKGGNTKWDKESFFAWWNGVDKLPTPVPEEDVQEEKMQIFFGGTENLPEEKIHWVEPESVQQEEAQESFVEEDVPWTVPEFKREGRFEPYIPQTTCPRTGSMTFNCPASIALNTLKELLQNEMVSIRVTWDVIEEGGAEDGKGC